MKVDSKRQCVIDIGTNSIRMLVGEIRDGAFYIIKKDMRITRIGRDVDKEKILPEDKMRETIDVIVEFKREAEREGALATRAIATSAVRDAKNKGDFIERVRRAAGIDVEVIDGKREAELGFKGVLAGTKAKGNILVIDIGGGSTELILGNREGIIFSCSINIGAVRLTEKFITANPIPERDIKKMEDFIKASIREPLEEIKNHPIEEVVGIGGTITNLAAIKEGMVKYDREIIHNYSLEIKDIKRIFEDLIAMDINERSKVKGMQAKRADIIPAGIKILIEVLSAISINKITVSEYDNLEGYIFSNPL